MTDFSERTGTATIGTPQDREAFRYAFTLSSANLQTEASQPIRPYRGIIEVGTVAVRQTIHIGVVIGLKFVINSYKSFQKQ